MNIQIPNIVVYSVLFLIIFGISIWLLAFHGDSPTNWILWVTMATAFFASLVRFALPLRKKTRT